MFRGLLIACLLAAAMVFPALAAQVRGVGGTVSDSPETKYAIIIGINQYEDQGIGDLSYAVSDAKSVYAALTGAPDGFDPSHTVLLADDVPDARPTRANILRFLNARLLQVSENDTVLIYFAGHGMPVKKELEGKAQDCLYLLPCDAALWPLEETAIAFSAIQVMLENAPACRKILILDACHSGEGRALNKFSNDVHRQFESVGEGTFILAACSAEETSHERPELNHGAFSYFLLEGLQGAADKDDNGNIGVLELGSYTSRKTREWAASQGTVQTPWQFSKFSADIPLARPFRNALPVAVMTPSITSLTGQNRIYFFISAAVLLFFLVLWRLFISRKRDRLARASSSGRASSRGSGHSETRFSGTMALPDKSTIAIGITSAFLIALVVMQVLGAGVVNVRTDRLVTTSQAPLSVIPTPPKPVQAPEYKDVEVAPRLFVRFPHVARVNEEVEIQVQAQNPSSTSRVGTICFTLEGLKATLKANSPTIVYAPGFLVTHFRWNNRASCWELGGKGAIAAHLTELYDPNWPGTTGQNVRSVTCQVTFRETGVAKLKVRASFSKIGGVRIALRKDAVLPAEGPVGPQGLPCGEFEIEVIK